LAGHDNAHTNRSSRALRAGQIPAIGIHADAQDGFADVCALDVTDYFSKRPDKAGRVEDRRLSSETAGKEDTSATFDERFRWLPAPWTSMGRALGGENIDKMSAPDKETGW
jgi:hypothetical protein